jgi:hypothetical protein
VPEEMVTAAGERLILEFELFEAADWFPDDEIPAQPTQRQARTDRKTTVPTRRMEFIEALPFW